jgi:MFS family permease
MQETGKEITMTGRALALTLMAGSVLAASTMTGCQNMPGTPRAQMAVAGAVVGGVIGGFAAGTWWAGALIGAGIGLVGGWIIGFALEEWFGWQGMDTRAAIEMPMMPATPEQALAARTADLNGDGIVGLDELLAMHQAGFTEAEILERLEATEFIFEVNPAQEEFLISCGVSPGLIRTLPDLNSHQRDRMLALIETTTTAALEQ